MGAKDAAIKSIGFNEETFNHKAVDQAINNFFAPEFRNRLDGIVKFDALEPSSMKRIVTKFLRQVEGYVDGRNLVLEWQPALLEMLERDGYDPKMGARPLARLINERVKLPIARYLLNNENMYHLKVDWVNDELVIADENKPPQLEAKQ